MNKSIFSEKIPLALTLYAGEPNKFTQGTKVHKIIFLFCFLWSLLYKDVMP
jgi:hypothetical protein